MGQRRSPLTVEQILYWADDHWARTGRWPRAETSDDASLPEGERWRNIDQALRVGLRGLAGGDSLARLLDRERFVRNVHALPRLTEARVLRWARAHRKRTGRWPSEGAGRVLGTQGEVWRNIDAALRDGTRGLPGGDSLARLLQRRAGARHRLHPPPLSVAQILAWAKVHQTAVGNWPTARSGPICGVPGETWHGVNRALRLGRRGLPGGDSLALLLLGQGMRG
jgi:hypothetical protein